MRGEGEHQKEAEEEEEGGGQGVRGVVLPPRVAVVYVFRVSQCVSVGVLCRSLCCRCVSSFRFVRWCRFVGRPQVEAEGERKRCEMTVLSY